MVANLKDKIKNGELNLSSSGLKEFPLKELAGLKHVSSINLSNNKISSVPKGVGTLTHISKLDLSKNQIKGLPEAIGNLSHLKHLNLSKNQITTIPATLGQLKSLKHLDLGNNPLAQKFSELLGPFQNENQCQQAARNLIKAFSSQPDSDKKTKKKDSEQESKKKKNDKKAQNGGITTQTKQKERKQKKSNKGFFSKFLDKILFVVKTTLFAILFVVFSTFLLSYYDENRYKAIKTQVTPFWHSALSRVCNEDTVVKVDAVLKQTEVTLNNTIITSTKFVAVQSQWLYNSVTTDERFVKFVDQVKVTFRELWSKIGISGGGEQKS